MKDYSNMGGLAGSQFNLLNNQTSDFGTLGTSLTDDALSSNSNIPTNQGFGAGFKGALGIDGKGGLFGLNGDTWGTIGDVGNLGLGLAETLAGFDQLALAKKITNANIRDKDRAYAMAKDAYDRNKARADSISSQMNAGKVGA